MAVEQGQDGGERCPEQVGADHDPDPGEPVDQGAGERGKQQNRDDLGQHDAGDAERAAGQAQYQQSQCHAGEHIAPLGDGPCCPQPPVGRRGEHAPQATSRRLGVHSLGEREDACVPASRSAASAKVSRRLLISRGNAEVEQFHADHVARNRVWRGVAVCWPIMGAAYGCNALRIQASGGVPVRPAEVA